MAESQVQAQEDHHVRPAADLQLAVLTEAVQVELELHREEQEVQEITTRSTETQEILTQAEPAQDKGLQNEWHHLPALHHVRLTPDQEKHLQVVLLQAEHMINRHPDRHIHRHHHRADLHHLAWVAEAPDQEVVHPAEALDVPEDVKP